MNGSIVGAVTAAETGPVLTAELIPLTGWGKVRVTYNWLYSALNCDPNDTSPFAWVLHKMSNGMVVFSPQQQYNGMTLYASVRPDLSYYVQVQAPFSACWITAVGADEEMSLVELGLFTVEMHGVNGRWVEVDSTISSYEGHSGHQLQGAESPDDLSKRFFLAVQQNLQERVSLPLFSSLTPADISAELVQVGVADPEPLAQRIFKAAEPNTINTTRMQGSEP